MGFFGSIIKSAIKITILPLAVTVDIIELADGKNPEKTVDLIESSIEDLTNAFDL
jgi:hypothetical protein